MKKVLLLSILLSLLVGGSLVAQKMNYGKIVDPQVIAQRELQKKQAEKTGFGDIEIDLLHRSIKASLPQLMTSEYLENRDEFIKQQSGVYVFTLPIANGESIKSISERYIYNGEVSLYTDAEGKNLDLVKITFRRLNPFGNRFMEEKREIENPTPTYFDDGKIDRNDDIKLIYYDTAPPKDKWGFDVEDPNDKDFSTAFKLKSDVNFKKKFEIDLKSVPFFDKRLKIMETYKKYLRRTDKRVKKKLYDLELKQRVQLGRMLDVK